MRGRCFICNTPFAFAKFSVLRRRIESAPKIGHLNRSKITTSRYFEWRISFVPRGVVLQIKEKYSYSSSHHELAGWVALSRKPFIQIEAINSARLSVRW